MSEVEQAPPTPPQEDRFSISEKSVEISSSPLPPPADSFDTTPSLSEDPTLSESFQVHDAKPSTKILADSSADPQSHFRAIFYSLIYWEKPVKSGIALGSTLLFLILSSYFSPLRFIAGLWSLSILGNLVFVHATLQYKRLTNKPTGNPHESRIKLIESGLLEKTKIDQWVSLAVDGINVAAQSGGKIVLIEDGRRSLTWVGWGFATYVVAGWLSTRWILGLATILSFSLPKLYIENKVVVDEQIAKANAIAREQADKAQALAQQHAGPYYEKVTALGQQYGLVAKSKGE